MPDTTRALRRNVLASFVRASLASTVVVSSAHAASVCTVVTNGDDPASASAAVTAQTISGTLRDCILASNLLTGAVGAPSGSMTISFSAAAFTGGAANTIILGDALPMIFNNTTIDASALTQPVVIDGGGAHRIFFVSGLPDSTVFHFNPDLSATVPDPDGAQPLAVTLDNLVLKDGLAKGGTSGGMGAGGALFVNKNATVTLNGIGFINNNAIGGSGLQRVLQGGGGMGGDSIFDSCSGGGLGFSSTIGTFGGIGGGLGPGYYTYPPDAGSSAGLTLALGFGGTGIGQISSNQGFKIGSGGIGQTNGALNPYNTSGYALISNGRAGIGAGGRGHGGFGGGGDQYYPGGFGGGGGSRAGGGFGGGGGSGKDAA